jgi:hypothetical protein
MGMVSIPLIALPLLTTSQGTDNGIDNNGKLGNSIGKE